MVNDIMGSVSLLSFHTDVPNYVTESDNPAADDEAVIIAENCSRDDEADTGYQAIPEKEILQPDTNLNKLMNQTVLPITAPLRFNKNLIRDLDRIQTSLARYPWIKLYPITCSLIISVCHLPRL
jgi:hypothetical protein